MDFRDLSFERISFLLYLCSNRRSSLGLRELKHCFRYFRFMYSCRSPLGLRELKLYLAQVAEEVVQSQPAWAAWIEKQPAHYAVCVSPRRSPLGLRELKQRLRQGHARCQVAARLGCVNWNKTVPICLFSPTRSQPAWAAWIETTRVCCVSLSANVVARLGCVNWNTPVPRIEVEPKSRSPFGLRELKHD